MTKRSNNCLRDVMTEEEERAYYETVLAKIYVNPRYYLDNLELLDIFRVSFLSYSESRRVKPPRREDL